MVLRNIINVEKFKAEYDQYIVSKTIKYMHLFIRIDKKKRYDKDINDYLNYYPKSQILICEPGVEPVSHYLEVRLVFR